MCKPFEFYGSVTVGERGQVVIPAEARAEMGYAPGEKLLVMRHPGHEGLIICRLEGIQAFLDEFTNQVARAASSASSDTSEATPHAEDTK